MKAAVLVLLLLAVIVLPFTPVEEVFKEWILPTFEALGSAWWAPILLIALYVVASCLGVPVSPLMLAGAAIFGFALGSLYNLIGLMLGALSSFEVAKLLGRDFVLHVTRGKIRRAEALFNRHGFWPLVQVRFVPFPFAVVNYGAALSGVRPGLFALATAVGLLPATLVHTFFIDALFKAESGHHLIVLAQYLVVLGVFNVITGAPTIRAWLRQRQLRREMEAKEGEST